MIKNAKFNFSNTFQIYFQNANLTRLQAIVFKTHLSVGFFYFVPVNYLGWGKQHTILHKIRMYMSETVQYLGGLVAGTSQKCDWEQKATEVMDSLIKKIPSGLCPLIVMLLVSIPHAFIFPCFYIHSSWLGPFK